MLTLPAKIRKIIGRKVQALREQGFLPAVLYGPKTKDRLLELDLKEFKKVYQEAGESSMVSLKIGKNGSGAEEIPVLIKEVSWHPLSSEPLHVDFYQPKMGEKVEAAVPLVFEGEAPAVKELGGTLVKNLSEIDVKALPQELPSEIKIDVSRLKTCEENILVKDIKVPEAVEILKPEEEVIVSIVPPKKVEAEAEEKPSEDEAAVEGQEKKAGERPVDSAKAQKAEGKKEK